MHASVVRKVRALPDRPGIYIFIDGASRPLYVGKANSLRKRVASYLKQGHEPRLEVMLSEARGLDFLVTDSGAEALLAEPGAGHAIRSFPVPLGRWAAPDEIAAVIAFLLGPEAGFVHGAVWYVDGGSDAMTRPDRF